MSYTCAKGSHLANKKTKKWVQQKEQGVTEGSPGLAHQTVRCTRGLQAQLRTFGNFQRRFAIIHRTVRCTTGQCPILQRRATLNSPASDFCSAIIHRTCPVSQRSNDYFAPIVVCNALNARQRAQRSRARAGGTPDSPQDLSGAPPDSQAGPHVRAPTVGTQRPGDVAGAPDRSVRHATAASTKRLVWWLGL
jgi:hypothetical protein